MCPGVVEGVVRYCRRKRGTALLRASALPPIGARTDGAAARHGGAVGDQGEAEGGGPSLAGGDGAPKPST